MKERGILLFLVMAVLLACTSSVAAGDLILGPSYPPEALFGVWDDSKQTYILTHDLAIDPFDNLIINSGVTLKISSGVNIFNYGTITNHGTIYNSGNSIIDNHGTINNYIDGTINNYGIIINYLFIDNYGTIYNYGCNNYIDGITGPGQVLNVNNAPILYGIGNQEVNEGDTLTIKLSASDTEVSIGEQALTYSTNAPFGTLSGNEFTWTPGYGDAGSYDVQFSVSDGCEVDSETITITVNNVNDPASVPEFPTIAIPVIAVIGLAFIFQRRKD